MDIKCSGCNDDLVNDCVFGFYECFDVHKYCYCCIFKLSISELRCPKDGILSKWVVKMVENTLVDVDKYFFDVIREMQPKSSKKAYKLIKELNTINDSILSLSRCGRCFNDEVIELKCGLSECYPRHRFCFNCIAEIATNELCCPIDQKVNKLIVITINGITNFRNKLYFRALKFLDGQNTERSIELIDEIKLNGEIGLSLCCMCMKDFDNEYVFGFAQCFYNHGFCFDCILKLFGKKLNCPFDGHSGKIMQKSFTNEVSEVKKSHLDIMLRMKQVNNDRPNNMIFEIPFIKDLNSIDHCCTCKNSTSREIMFGLKECFVSHIFCIKCIEGVVMQGLRCPIDHNNCSGIKIVTNETTLDIDRYHFEMIKIFASRKYTDVRQLIAEVIICSEIGSQQIRCKKCFIDLRNEAIFGFSECIKLHGFCFTCMDKMSRFGLHCPLCIMDSPNLRIITNNLAVDLDRYHLATIEYLRSIGSEISNQLCNNIMFIKSFPTNVCIVCFSSKLNDKFMIGYEECVVHHRMCVQCAITSHYNGARKCVMNHDREAKSVLHAITNDHVVGIADLQPRKVDQIFMMTYHYLCHKSINRDESVNCQLKIHMQTTLECPLNVCIECLKSIYNTSYGFLSCHQYHVFCETCATTVTTLGNVCPVDGTEIASIYKTMLKNEVTTVLDVHYFRIMNYLQSPLFNKSRSKFLRDSLHEYRFFSNSVCITCLEDIKNGAGVSTFQCSFNHTLCGHCAIKLDPGTCLCPIDACSFHRC